MKKRGVSGPPDKAFRTKMGRVSRLPEQTEIQRKKKEPKKCPKGSKSGSPMSTKGGNGAKQKLED